MRALTARSLAPLAVVAGGLLASPSADAQLCGASVASYARVGETKTFSVPVVSCTNRPDPEWIVEKPDGSRIRRTGFSFSLNLDQAGKWLWDVVGYSSICFACTDSGSITVEGAGCQIAVTAKAVPRSPARELTVDFSATATPSGPCQSLAYAWTFGDGQTATGSSALSHTYERIDAYPWSVTVSSAGVSQGAGGTVSLPCLDVGGLPFCASTSIRQTKGTQGQPDTFDLAGTPSLHDLVFFDVPVTYRGSPASGTGTVSFSGSLYAKIKGGVPSTIVKGSGVVYDVDAARSELLPRTVPESYDLRVSGVPLLVDGRPIVLGPGFVEMSPTFFVGVPGVFTLASMKLTMRLPKAGDKTITAMEVINGQVTPSITFLTAQGTYDPEKDRLEGSFGVSFPFMGTWSVAAAFRIERSCFNGVDFSLGLPEPVPIGLTGLGVAGLTFKVDGICDLPAFQILLGGDVGIVAVPGEVFAINDVLAGYQAPYSLMLKGGTAKLAGYPLASLEGRISFYRPLAVSLTGGYDVAGILVGELSTALIVSKLLWVGSYTARANVPDFSCDWYNVPCRSLRTALSGVVTLPAQVAGVEYDVYVDPGVAQFRGTVQLGSFRPALLVEVTAGRATLLVGPNYTDLYGITVAPGERAPLSPLERVVTIPAGSPAPLIFTAAVNASGSSTVPDLQLRAPDGRTITPAQPGAGVRFASSAALATATCTVDQPQAGAWRLSVTNLAEGDVTFQVVGPKPPPELTFTSVSRDGDRVRVDAAVSPALAATKVSLFWSTSSGRHDGQPIALDVPAGTGAVSATWDLTGLPAGAYYVYARADDGKNAPILFFHPEAVSIAGSLAAPTGLSGTFGSGTASLSWTRPGGNVAGHVVRYTDEPTRGGYPFELSVPAGDAATVNGLDPARSWRFAVAAYDARGAFSLDSTPWTTPAAETKPGDCDGDGRVSSDELQRVVAMALGLEPPACGADADGDGRISASELQAVVNRVLEGKALARRAGSV